LKPVLASDGCRYGSGRTGNGVCYLVACFFSGTDFAGCRIQKTLDDLVSGSNLTAEPTAA
jgi:hypothetical protein